MCATRVAHSKIALYALIFKQLRVYNYIFGEDKQDDPGASDYKGDVRPGLPRCRDAAMSDSWTSGRSGVGLAAYEAER